MMTIRCYSSVGRCSKRSMAHGYIVWCYGPCARGTEETESDIDLLVLLEGPVDGAQEIRRIWTVLYPLQLESARLLSVMPVDVALYNRGEYALYRQAKAEGVPL